MIAFNLWKFINNLHFEPFPERNQMNDGFQKYFDINSAKKKKTIQNN